MKKLKTLLVALLAAIAAPHLTAQPTATPIKREFRSTWIAALGIDFGYSTFKSTIDKYTSELAAQNYTAVCLHARPMADAMYESKLVPWSSYASGTRGQSPGYDPLQYAIDAAHSKGLELYAWLNPFRWQNKAEVDFNTSYDQQWKANGWGLNNDAQTILNPSIPEVRAHFVEVVREIIENYQVDGIIFDDYFYCNGGTAENSSAQDYQIWKNSGTSLSLAAWRRENVNKMVADIYNMIQEVKPDVRFGIGPPGVSGTSAAQYGFPTISGIDDWPYSSIYCDPLAWLKAGTIDYVSPQIYWKVGYSVAPFEKLSEWWSKCAAQANRHNYVSHNIYSSWDYSETVSQINLNRQYTKNNAAGFNLYSARWINGPTATGLGEYIFKNATQTKVLQPEVTWHADKQYAFSAPANAQKSGSTLSWDAQSYGNRIVKYSVYAVPLSVEPENAQSNDGDGISAEYLQGITYTNSFTLAEDKTSGYWYAVCVYDGFSKEWEPATIGYVQLPDAPAVTLASPADGAIVEGEFTLKWNTADVDSYTVQVSRTSNFTSFTVNTTTTASSITLESEKMGKGTSYWRVVANKEGYKSAASASRTFVVENVSTGGTELGYYVQTDGHSYASQGEVSMQNDWIRSYPMGNFVQDGAMNSGTASATGVSAGSYNRDMVVAGDYVYVAGRNTNSTDASLYLRHYDRYTGEHMGDIILSGTAANVALYPCNDLIKDSKGNVYIANLTTNSSTNPLVICKVDLETGTVTQKVSLTYSSSGDSNRRIDHCNIYGDVESGNYYVFAAVANSARVVRWQVSNGKAGSAQYTKIGTFFPTNFTTLGTAPIIIPVGESDFFVDGYNTALTRYTFKSRSTATLTGTFASATYSGALSTNTLLNGATIFPYNGDNYIGYVCTASPGKFSIVKTNSSYTYSSMTHQWTFPNGSNFGSHSSGTFHAPMDYILNADGSLSVYVYIPGSGLACYTMRNRASSVDAIRVENNAPVRYYNLQGLPVENPQNGIFIRVQGNTATKIIR